MKGCFLSALVILTIVIAAIIYTFKFHSDDVTNMVKPMLIKIVKSDLDSQIKKLEISPLSDSLKSMVKKYTRDLENSNTINLSDAQSFFENVGDAIDDGKLDSLEFTKLDILLKKHVKK